MQIIYNKSLKDTMYFGEIPVLTYEINYPYFTTTCSRVAAVQINEYYAHNAKKTEDYCRNVLYPEALEIARYIQDGRPFNSYTLIADFKITYNLGCITSLYMDTYTYTGGAHGMTTRSSDTWNFNNGERLLLNELNPENPYFFTWLQTQIAMEVTQRLQLNPGTYFEDYESLVTKYFNPQNFYLIPNGFVIFYQLYDISPYYVGMPEFSFIDFPIAITE